MTHQADRVDFGPIQHVRIRSAVREVACRTTFGLDHCVFIHKWSGHFGMALRADYVLMRGIPRKLLSKCSVRLVAVRAQDQSFFYLVAGGHGELRLDVAVALKAELRLSDREQMFRRPGTVDAVAPDAAHIALAVSRAFKDRVLARMATQATIVYLPGRGYCRVENLELVPAALNMRLAGPVAVCTSHDCSAMHCGRPGMRIVDQTPDNPCMAGGASGVLSRMVVSGD